MSTTLLGSYFDLHGGGEDLKFPHHENEIAQSCAACDSRFVKTWMHNGFVRVNDEKMSKSLGNFFTVREVLKTLRHPEVMRFFLLSSHLPPGPINYSEAQLAQAGTRLCWACTDALKDAPGGGQPDAAEVARFRAAMDDDFNTPEALAVMQGVARSLNLAKAARDETATAKAAATLRALGETLGILQQEPDSYLKRSVGIKQLADDEVERLLESRRAARAEEALQNRTASGIYSPARGYCSRTSQAAATEWRRWLRRRRHLRPSLS